MFVFSTVGISLASLIFSLFQSQDIVTRNGILLERGGAYIVTKPSITPIPIPSINPTQLDTPTPTYEAILQPTSAPSRSDAIGDEQTYIMNAINTYRSSKGLSPVTTNNVTCNFAKVRAQEIASNFSHDGFNQRIQNHGLPYSSYALITENIAETGDYKNVVTLWINSAPHAENMRADTPYVCVESYGNYYAYEGWRPL